MKKLLTLLLTLVMAVCLVNLNNSHAKADEGNTSYTYTWNGTAWSPENPQASYNAGDKIKLVNSSTKAIQFSENQMMKQIAVGNEYEHEVVYDKATLVLSTELIKASITDMPDYTFTWNGSSWYPSPTSVPDTIDAGKTYTIKNSSGNTITVRMQGNAISIDDGKSIGGNFGNNGGTVILDNDNATAIITYFNPSAPTPCQYIQFDGTTWQDGATVINKTQLKNTYGIEYTEASGGNPAKIKLTKSLKSSDQSFPVLQIKNNSLTIELGNDIELYSEKFGTLLLSPTASDTININGNGNTLTLKSNNNLALNIKKGTVNLNNVIVDVTTNATLVNAVKINNGGTLIFNGNSELRAKNQADAAFYSISDPTLNGDYEILGTEDGSTTGLKTATRNNIVGDTNRYIYQVDNGSPTNAMVNAKYIVIRPKEQPKPVDPSPSQPKDESCEKVIGPTWHWNNDKGICEEYATVGTATR